MRIINGDKNHLVIQTKISNTGTSKSIRLTRIVALYDMSTDCEYRVTIEPVKD